MKVQGTMGSGMGEDYWHAILSQGEVPDKHLDSDAGEPWEGFEYPLDETPPEEYGTHKERDTGCNNRWALANDCLETGEILELAVTSYNRGGLLVDWDGLQGFVPASHLVGFSPYLDDEGRRSELERRVGKQLKLKVIELDPQDERFILSERAATDEEQRRLELLNEIQPGEVRQGCVTNLCSFGAFVDLGGVEGLIHISELSWGRIDHPSDVLNSGQLIDVYVLNVIPSEGRVGLSLKRLLPDPWETVEERYDPGQLIEGKVTNVVSFGAFVRLEEGLEGLVHVSELAEGNFLHPRNVVQEGETVVARVLSVNGKRRRMALSLRQIAGAEDESEEEEAEQEMWTADSMPAAIYQS